MAFATELTVATGQTLYAGDPESDERIQSREVRVSVTYQLERDDIDILLLTAVKAAEVAKAHQTACQQMQQELLHQELAQPPRASGVPQPVASQTGDDEDADEGQEEPEDEDEGEASRFAQPTPPRPGYNGHQAHEGNGYSGYSSNSNNTARGYTPPAAAQEPTEPMATKPLQLAIRAAATRQGLSEYALSTVLRERFHTFRLEKLTKEQATSLLQALNNGEITAPNTPAAGQTSHASRPGSRR